ncbi:hypothetical protein KFL_004770060 [Klebsormidium nitens]|uniref:Sel1 repeat family protein n=1 Tax=Klebsormidium nitens TaxID=105231 RepID=A0A1Y1IHM7_KLENI|nr:hypothetical protein KFL_004770060 [Klebsormidium nitens]|eukprot:GAQ88999.1 hypothetical protein KFL_004770060 [Klebsormidium nitens]
MPAGDRWLAQGVRGYAASATTVEEPDSAEEFYARASELLRQVEDAAETTGQRAEENDELRGKLEEAAECLEISLGEGRSDPRALFALSQLHEKYDLPGFSADRALSLLYHAAKAGSAEAQYELASRLRLQDEEGDPGGGRSQLLLTEAAAQGHTDAMFLLGAAELRAQAEGGHGAASAKQWFKRAADLGHVPAASIYGVLLLKDSPEPASRQEAKRYLDFAAGRGEALAADWLTSIKTS